MHSASTGSELQPERIRLLVETIKDYAIIILNLDGEVTTWNAGAERIKGYSGREIIGRRFCTARMMATVARASSQSRPLREERRTSAGSSARTARNSGPMWWSHE